MLTIKNKKKLDNSKIVDGEQILNTSINFSENSNATKTQENSNKIIMFSAKMYRDRKSISKNFNFNKKVHISTRF